MSFWKGFIEWFCGKEQTMTTEQFSKMMKTVEKKREDSEEEE